jgi:hypothetical protein
MPVVDTQAKWLCNEDPPAQRMSVPVTHEAEDILLAPRDVLGLAFFVAMAS